MQLVMRLGGSVVTTQSNSLQAVVKDPIEPDQEAFEASMAMVSAVGSGSSSSLQQV